MASDKPSHSHTGDDPSRPPDAAESSEPVKLRALVVDDSAYNRQTITAMLESLPNMEVVGRAMNGKEALRLVFDLAPDVITLDLEMPEMDGFAFLRLLMNKRPTPVLVVSGYAQRENVFRALELGALDFLAKPTRDVSPDLKNIKKELLAKISVVRKLQAVRLRDRARSLAATTGGVVGAPLQAAPIENEALRGPVPLGVVGLAASTGGPPAIQQLLCGLPRDLPLAVIVAQHMPARFTAAFAHRLDRIVDVRVVEAMDGQPLCAGTVYIAPGSSNVEVTPATEPRAHPVVRVMSVAQGGLSRTITPSADHLFKSLGACFGRKMCAVVLTGMGSDGRAGAIAARGAGAFVLAEDPDTAVMPGMPYSVIEAGVVDEVLALEQMAAKLVEFGRRCTDAE
jgi:two-component system, chemotaxis family, protein-glutamate methylesterase/glutaminase